MQDIISQKEIQKYLLDPSLGVYVFDSIDSTNSFAKTLTEDFALVVSDSQSQGRGRLGRVFFSPPESGIYMTLKAKIPSLYDNVPFITTLAAVAVHKAIQKLYAIECGIKWVNDIYIKNKKVAGILCEVHDHSHAVIGIGINFHPSPMPDDLKNIATHLIDDLSLTRCELIGEISNNLLNLISLLPDVQFMEYYKTHSMVIGKSVLCIQGENSFEAVCTDIDSRGALVVKTHSGIRTLSSGEITIRFTD